MQGKQNLRATCPKGKLTLLFCALESRLLQLPDPILSQGQDGIQFFFSPKLVWT